MPWITRLAVLATVLVLLILGPEILAVDPTRIILGILGIAVAVVGGEYLNLVYKRRISEVKVSGNGIEIEPPRLYLGRRMGRRTIFNKDQVVEIELARTKSPLHNSWMSPPEGGWPSSLVFTTADGKVRSAIRRDPAELMAAVDFISRAWGRRVEDSARRPVAPPGMLYHTYVNDVGKSRFRGMVWWVGIMLIFPVAFIAMIDAGHAPTLAKIGVTGFFGALIVYMLVMLRLAQRQMMSLTSVIIEEDGFELLLESDSRRHSWRDLTGLRFVPTEQLVKTRDKIAIIKVGKRERYDVTIEVAKALENGYASAMGQRPPTFQR